VEIDDVKDLELRGGLRALQKVSTDLDQRMADLAGQAKGLEAATKGKHIMSEVKMGNMVKAAVIEKYIEAFGEAQSYVAAEFKALGEKTGGTVG
jgi:hypothetical protein